MSDPFEECRKCRGDMILVSEEKASPLIMECKKCGHQEYAEVQIPPPWPPENKTRTDVQSEPKKAKSDFRIFESSAVPVSTGSPDDESPIVPVGWIILWVLIIALVLLLFWIVL